VWFTWPQNADTWTPVWEEAKAVYDTVIRHALRFQDVNILVSTPKLKAELEARFADARARSSRLPTILVCPTNDSWIRDYGGQTVRASDGAGRVKPVVVSFGFNSWGGKYPPFDLDDAVPPQMAQRLSVPVVPVDHILEGGSIDVNGAGAVLTTRACLLNPNRNPHRSQGDIEALLHDCLGTEQVLWLGDGIVGDDTDGHVDDITRFVAGNRVITAMELNPADPNHVPLQENRELLETFRLADGRSLEIVELPMPEPVWDSGQRLPASYANFYIANGLVLVPVFGCDQDADALAIIGGCFPERTVLGVDCRDVVAGLGTLHCLSQQVPAV
jgi:agmatine deiminase